MEPLQIVFCVVLGVGVVSIAAVGVGFVALA
jgi:hypothetical protein